MAQLWKHHPHCSLWSSQLKAAAFWNSGAGGGGEGPKEMNHSESLALEIPREGSLWSYPGQILFWGILNSRAYDFRQNSVLPGFSNLTCPR